MKTQIRKIGNSAGTILPAHLLRKLDLAEGDAVEITDDGHRIVITPKRERPTYTLDELLAASDYSDQPDDEREWVDAPPAGKEPF